MCKAGKEGSQSRLLLTNQNFLFLTLKNHPSPWQFQHTNPPNPFIRTTYTPRLIASFLLRFAGSACSLTFRPGTTELYILPICGAYHGNGIEDIHAHGWLPWPLDAKARAHPLETTAFLPGHPHQALWRSLQHFRTENEQHPLYLATFHHIDQKANRIPPEQTPACFQHTPWSTLSPTRTLWTHLEHNQPPPLTPIFPASPQPHQEPPQSGGPPPHH